jgi:N-acyl-D-amino-acid deacylase
LRRQLTPRKVTQGESLVKRVPIFFLVVLLCFSLSFSVASQQTTYDLLITGGRVFDGSGNPWFAADLAIKNGKLAALGNLSNATARRTIDARGLYVTPGFIDLHSHADEGLGSKQTNANPNGVTQGITTVVVNQDGRSSTNSKALASTPF